MKKKIKDLTLEELKNICAMHSCSICPLNDIVCSKYFNVSEIQDMKWNKKIEVKSDEKEMIERSEE